MARSNVPKSKRELETLIKHIEKITAYIDCPDGQDREHLLKKSLFYVRQHGGLDTRFRSRPVSKIMRVFDNSNEHSIGYFLEHRKETFTAFDTIQSWTINPSSALFTWKINLFHDAIKKKDFDSRKKYLQHIPKTVLVYAHVPQERIILNVTQELLPLLQFLKKHPFIKKEQKEMEAEYDNYRIETLYEMLENCIENIHHLRTEYEVLVHLPTKKVEATRLQFLHKHVSVSDI